jgi:hypothetical protein
MISHEGKTAIRGLPEEQASQRLASTESENYVRVRADGTDLILTNKEDPARSLFESSRAEYEDNHIQFGQHQQVILHIRDILRRMKRKQMLEILATSYRKSSPLSRTMAMASS